MHAMYGEAVQARPTLGGYSLRLLSLARGAQRRAPKLSTDAPMGSTRPFGHEPPCATSGPAATAAVWLRAGAVPHTTRHTRRGCAAACPSACAARRVSRGYLGHQGGPRARGPRGDRPAACGVGGGVGVGQSRTGMLASLVGSGEWQRAQLRLLRASDL